MSLSRGGLFVFPPEMSKQLQCGPKTLASVTSAPHCEKFAKHFKYIVACHNLDSTVNETPECNDPEKRLDLLYEIFKLLRPEEAVKTLGCLTLVLPGL